jgi:prepilin peptidase CpaA
MDDIRMIVSVFSQSIDPNIVKTSCALVFLGISNVTDLRERKIKNKAVLCFLIVGFALNLFCGGFAGLVNAFAGASIPLALFPLFALRMLGAGDVKALCAVGSIVGFYMSVLTILFSIVAGGVIALGFMLFWKNGIERIRYLFAYIKTCFLMMKLLPYGDYSNPKSHFRFSFGITAGFLIAAVNQYMGIFTL